MSWIKRLIGSTASAGAACPPDWSIGVGDGPAPTWSGAFGESPLHQLLDEIGVPWREPRGALEARIGVETDPAYQWQVLPFRTDAPLVEGAIQPLSAQVWPELSPDVPPTEFFANAWWVDDARENTRRCAERLAPRLGPNRVLTQYNTVRCEWAFGAASLTLTGWPRDLQTHASSNPSHDRDPRLAEACHVHVRTGWRPPLSAAEAGWLAGFRPVIQRRAEVRASQLRASPAAESELEFVREPPDTLKDVLGAVGLSAGGEALIWASRQLYVVPAGDVARLLVHRMLPAKGPGGSSLQVEVRGGKRITLADASGVEELTGPGRKLGAALGCPVEVGEPSYDV